MKTKRQYFDAGQVEIKRKYNYQLELIITEYRGDWNSGTKHEIHIELVPCFVRQIAGQLWKVVNSWESQLESMRCALRGRE